MKKILLILLVVTFSSSAFADPKMELGLGVYNNKAQCGVCHTLQAAGSTGDIGPNFDQMTPFGEHRFHVQIQEHPWNVV